MTPLSRGCHSTCTYGNGLVDDSSNDNGCEVGCYVLQELWCVAVGDNDPGPQSVPRSGEQGTPGAD